MCGVIGGIHFCQNPNAEFVARHGGFDARVGCQAGEIGVRTFGFGEVWEREDGVESVGRFVLEFAPVAVTSRGCGLYRWG